jgi:CRP-like cAMP-binding protein
MEQSMSGAKAKRRDQQLGLIFRYPMGRLTASDAELSEIGALDTPVPQGRWHFDPEVSWKLGHEKPAPDDSSEQASALDDTRLMTWTATEIEDIVMKRPRLAVALLQILTQRTIDFTHRIEGFSVDNISRRLARSLLRFSDRLGTAEDDGSVRMAPFTHELLAQYVGTSREIVTHYMNQFRRRGYLRYSRKGITLYRDALNSWLLGAA